MNSVTLSPPPRLLLSTATSPLVRSSLTWTPLHIGSSHFTAEASHPAYTLSTLSPQGLCPWASPGDFPWHTHTMCLPVLKSFMSIESHLDMEASLGPAPLSPLLIYSGHFLFLSLVV